jgi:hypothetical protein
MVLLFLFGNFQLRRQPAFLSHLIRTFPSSMTAESSLLLLCDWWSFLSTNQVPARGHILTKTIEI